MAWSFYYMFMGFRSTLPWQSCTTSTLQGVASDFCYSKYDNDLCMENRTQPNQWIFFNRTCTTKEAECRANHYSVVLVGWIGGRLVSPVI